MNLRPATGRFVPRSLESRRLLSLKAFFFSKHPRSTRCSPSVRFSIIRYRRLDSLRFGREPWCVIVTLPTPQQKRKQRKRPDGQETTFQVDLISSNRHTWPGELKSGPSVEPSSRSESVAARRDLDSAASDGLRYQSPMASA